MQQRAKLAPASATLTAQCLTERIILQHQMVRAPEVDRLVPSRVGIEQPDKRLTLVNYKHTLKWRIFLGFFFLILLLMRRRIAQELTCEHQGLLRMVANSETDSTDKFEPRNSRRRKKIDLGRKKRCFRLSFLFSRVWEIKVQ